MCNNKKLMLIDTIDDYINIAEGELDYIKSKLVDYLNSKDFDIYITPLNKKDIYNFLEWYELNQEVTERVSLIRCKQIINFIFYSKLND